MDLTDDVFHAWKSNKFVVVERNLFPGQIIVVLSDFAFWSHNLEELLEWCNQYGGKVSGMTLTFDTTEQLTWFTLRWS